MEEMTSPNPVYVIQVDRTGKPFIPGEETTIGSFRLNAPSTLVLLVPFCDNVQANQSLNIYNGQGISRDVEPAHVDGDGATQYVVEIASTDAGPLRYQLKSQSFEDGSALSTPPRTLVVQAATPALDSLNMISIMPRNLGPAERWIEALSLTAYSKYTAIHFTPIQKLGISRSSFSLYDPLIVAPSIVGEGLSKEAAWKNLKKTVEQVEATLGLLSTQDIVLNHLSKDSPFMIENPQAGYNTENCPWLKAAHELDQRILRFSREIVEGKHRNRGVTEHINNAEDVERVVSVFRDVVLRPFAMGEWLRQDDSHRRMTLDRFTSRTALAEPIDHPLTVDEALRRSVGVARFGVSISETDMNRIPNMDAGVFERQMNEALGKLANEQEDIESSIIQSIRGNVTWERVEQKRGALRNEDGGTVVPNYFTTVTCPKDGKEYHLAHNGWVMGWDATKDFAQSGNTVYLGRRLCVWSDCFKVNYGDNRDNCPILWDTMEEYVRLTAKTFMGIRLDNCHSTPMHVAEYLLRAARSERPEIIVYAELFTNDRHTDATFEKRLGLSALIREVQHSRDPHSLAAIHQHYGAPPITGCSPASPPDLFVPPGVMTKFKGRPIFTPNLSMAPPILFDQTHDNQAQLELFPGAHSLAAAAVIAAGPSASGSTMGVDILVPHHLSVVFEDRMIESIQFEADTDLSTTPDSNSPSSAAKHCNKVVYPGGSEYNSVEVAGSWTNWKPQACKRVGSNWELNVDVNLTGRHLFKFIADGNWCNAPGIPMESGGHGNHVITFGDATGKLCDSDQVSSIVGMAEARRILNEIHTNIADGKFHNCAGSVVGDSPIVLYTRVNHTTFEAVHFVIHCAFHEQSRFDHGTMEIEVEGNFAEALCQLGLTISDSRRHAYHRDNAVINGIPQDAYQCIINEDNAALTQRIQPHASCNGKTKVTLQADQFPSGSVLVFKTTIGRGHESAQAVDRVLDHTADIIRKTLSTHDDALTAFSYLLYSAEPEEYAISEGGRGLYLIDGVDVRYCGISTPLFLLDRAFRDDHFHDWENRQSIVRNVIDGNWLWNYHADRLGVCETLFLVRDCIKENLDKVEKHQISPSFRPILLYRMLRTIFETIKEALIEQSSFKGTNDPLVVALTLSSLMFYASVNGSSLVEGTTKPSICAGLPHFSSGFMRAWGRDTFIALPGVLLCTGRINEAKMEILGFARTLRHGNIPNLLDSGNNSRFNARDATWFFLRALRLTCERLESKKAAQEFLDTPVDLKWNEVIETYGSVLPETYQQSTLTLKEMIHVILTCHHHGIDYTEWNAGTKIDEHMKMNGFHVVHRYDANTGLILGGNSHNCGTWMDKMGSSAKAGNKGVASTPRDGAPVEISAILGATLRWVVESLIPSHEFPQSTGSKRGEEGLMYTEWYATLTRQFHSSYYNETHHYYNDLFGSSNLPRCHDGQLRSNWFIAPAELPEAFSSHPDELHASMTNAREQLFGDPHQLGLKTLTPNDLNYRPRYVNDDDGEDPTIAHGANYHQGPEWVWPLGFMVMAYRSIPEGKKSTRNFTAVYRHQAKSSLCNHRAFVQVDNTMSLPELTQRDGAFCKYSCWSQAWSIGTCLEALEFIRDSTTAVNQFVSGPTRLSNSAVVEDAQDPKSRQDTRITIDEKFRGSQAVEIASTNTTESPKMQRSDDPSCVQEEEKITSKSGGKATRARGGARRGARGGAPRVKTATTSPRITPEEAPAGDANVTSPKRSPRNKRGGNRKRGGKAKQDNPDTSPTASTSLSPKGNVSCGTRRAEVPPLKVAPKRTM